jgi:hypothetical protein
MKYKIGDIVKINNVVYKDKIGIVINIHPQKDIITNTIYETIIAGLEGKKQYLFEYSIIGKIE